MTTNNAESLKGLFREERLWPIVALFDKVLETFSRWFCERREKAAMWDEVVTKYVKDKLDSRYLNSVSTKVNRLSQFEAEVKVGTDRFEVNLHARTYDCRVLQIHQIPCSHAIATATNRSMEVVDLISPYYRNEHVIQVYKETIHRVPPFDRWEVPPSVATIKCLPPVVRKRVGRPKVNRFKARWESNWAKNRRCGRCGMMGHVQRNCKRPPNPASAP